MYYKMHDLYYFNRILHTFVTKGIFQFQYIPLTQVGLAVDDVKGIQQAAVLKRLALRV